jgi:hypothetical protein
MRSTTMYDDSLTPAFIDNLELATLHRDIGDVLADAFPGYQRNEATRAAAKLLADLNDREGVPPLCRFGPGGDYTRDYRPETPAERCIRTLRVL